MITVGNFVYTVSGNSATLGTDEKVDDQPNAYPGDSTEGFVEIPSTIPSGSTTYTVTRIGHQAFKQAKLTYVHIPNTIKSIGEMAFAASQLKSVTIPSSVETIERAAFHLIDNLISVKFEYGSALKSISSSVFDRSKKIKIIVFPTSLSYIGPDPFSLWESSSSVYICSIHDFTDPEIMKQTSTKVYVTQAYKQKYKLFGGKDPYVDHTICPRIACTYNLRKSLHCSPLSFFTIFIKS